MVAPASLHPSGQTLLSYGLGKLDDTSAEAVNGHLEECAACRRRIAEMSGDSFLGRLRDAHGRPPAPGLSTSGVSRAASGPASPSTSPIQANSLPPELIDHPQYEIMRELGRGGMGVVYLARNTLMDRLEVLKVLNKEMLARRGTLDRFLREIRSAARLSHPNVVAAYSALQIGHLIVFAMEYVEGLDLAKMVKLKGPLPVGHASHFIHQAALGLQHAHEQGMIHRDIKPGNLILARKGDRAIVKVLDFGLAKATREDPVDSGLTQEGQMLGTPDFIAPEQTLNAQKSDIRADIYSLGCTLYYLLSGGPPFRGTSLYDILQAHHSIDAKFLNLLRTDVPVELAALVAKMMAKEPKRRFQTPGEVAKALTPFFKSSKAASIASNPELSQVDQPAGNWAAAKPAVSTPTEPATQWRSLLDFCTKERFAEKPAAAPNARLQKSRMFWPSIVTASVLGVILLCVAFHVSKPKGGSLASTNQEKSDPPEVNPQRAAEQLKEETLAEFKVGLAANPDATLVAMNNRASDYQNAGKSDQAILVYEQIVAMQREKLGPDHPDTWAAMAKLASASGAAGRSDIEVPVREQLLAAHKAKYGPDHSFTRNVAKALGSAYTRAGKLDKAMSLYEQSIAAARANGGPDDGITVLNMLGLARVYGRAGKVDQSLSLFEQTLAGHKALFGADQTWTLNAMTDFAYALLQAGKLEEAERLLREELAIHPKLSVDGISISETRNIIAQASALLSRILLRQKRYAEAEPLAREALATYQELTPPGDERQFETMYLLGCALCGQGQFATAEALLVQGFEGLRKRSLSRTENEEALAWLVRLYEGWDKPDEAAKWRREQLKVPKTTKGKRGT
jgi:serine/threonine protein kinase/tetratricopeptide (TPR) repeat protein